MTSPPAKARLGEKFFVVSPLVFFPQTSGKFEVYLKSGEEYVLYTRAQEEFTIAHRERLHGHGVEEVYILVGQREAYEEYVEANLGPILLNEELPSEVRARVFYDVSVNVAKEVFESRLPEPMTERHYERLLKLVKRAARFFSHRDSLKSVGKLICHDYKTYSHSVHVMIYALAILETFRLDPEELTAIGLGALLHDVGKTKVPRHVLNKKGKLSAEEWPLVKLHPVYGVAMCANMPLSQQAVNCIMFHHEREDGSGYPAGLKGTDLPLAAKVAGVCDVYDALTTNRPYATGVSPFQALKIMKDEMSSALDQEAYRRLIMILSGAAIID